MGEESVGNPSCKDKNMVGKARILCFMCANSENMVLNLRRPNNTGGEIIRDLAPRHRRDISPSQQNPTASALAEYSETGKVDSYFDREAAERK